MDGAFEPAVGEEELQVRELRVAEELGDLAAFNAGNEAAQGGGQGRVFHKVAAEGLVDEVIDVGEVVVERGAVAAGGAGEGADADRFQTL